MAHRIAGSLMLAAILANAANDVSTKTVIAHLRATYRRVHTYQADVHWQGFYTGYS
jgi:hypothetical protein